MSGTIARMRSIDFISEVDRAQFSIHAGLFSRFLCFMSGQPGTNIAIRARPPTNEASSLGEVGSEIKFEWPSSDGYKGIVMLCLRLFSARFSRLPSRVAIAKRAERNNSVIHCRRSGDACVHMQ